MNRNNFIKSLFGICTIPFIPKIAIGNPINNKRIMFTPEMLMRYNTGLFIIKAGIDVYTHNRIGYAATVCWKLIYSLERSIPKYGRCNFLTDGWFYPMANTKEELCELLNNDKEGFRVLTKEEVIYIIQNRQQGFL